jgi:hypothetical protein
MSSYTYSLEHNTIQCQEIQNIANQITAASDFSILNSGISQEDVETHSLNGSLKSKLAYKAAELELSLHDYALSLYDAQCRNK